MAENMDLIHEIPRPNKDSGNTGKASSESVDRDCQPKQAISHFKTNQFFLKKGCILI